MNLVFLISNHQCFNTRSVYFPRKSLVIDSVKFFRAKKAVFTSADRTATLIFSVYLFLIHIDTIGLYFFTGLHFGRNLEKSLLMTPSLTLKNEHVQYISDCLHSVMTELNEKKARKISWFTYAITYYIRNYLKTLLQFHFNIISNDTAWNYEMNCTLPSSN